MSDIITLSGDYGYTSYKFPSESHAVKIDASEASWIEANIGSNINLYPFQVSGADAGLIIEGGTINGEVPQDTDWTVTYVNSAGVRVANTPGVVIEDWRISRPWDGIRVVDHSDGFKISSVWITDSRDDAVENDDALGGTISNSLFDGVFSGISLGDGDVDGHNNLVTLDHVLLRSKSYLYKGDITHGSPFKLDKSSPDITPSLHIYDTVIAIEDVNHNGFERLAKAWAKTTDASGNYFLNLSDEKLPSDYPLPGKGWTILQGQAARDYWESARTNWIDHHGGDSTLPPADNTPVAFNSPADANPAANQVAANASAGTLVGITASATDPDVGDKVSYSVSDSRFKIDANGVITRSGTGVLDAKAEATVSLTVTATSTDASKATQKMAVSVIDGSAPPPDAHVSEVRIAASADDVEQRGSAISSTSSDLELVQDGSTAQTVGLRFKGLDVPHGALITRAYIQFRVDEADSKATTLTIHGDDSDNAAAFSQTAYDVTSRHSTSAKVSWMPPAWATVGAAGADQRTADLTALIQEIVDRSGWTAKNALALIISGSGERTAESYDGMPSAAPLLHVEWKASGGTSGGVAGSATVIKGTSGANVLAGTAQADDIHGLAGADRISGKGGNDILTGGADTDAFVFKTAPHSSANHDVISDFVAAYDRIYLDNAVFTRLGSGSLSSPHTLSSSYFDDKADDGNDYILYNKSTGALSYDADGSGAGAAVDFAKIGAGLAITCSDIFVV